ncbi:hypothetical protein CDAR_554111 [Caerostris darwini]|uniref:Uncharacterized protein n=1 Tax=Caerostris darwini TaxID=1538125 RepID=A0AAV4X5U6_9ARAC|nr:hypothetical protein CDAR_554111 [Caerostris darwini]
MGTKSPIVAISVGVVGTITLAMTSHHPAGDFLGEEKVANYSLWDEPASFVSAVTYSLSDCRPLWGASAFPRGEERGEGPEKQNSSDRSSSSGL